MPLQRLSRTDGSPRHGGTHLVRVRVRVRVRGRVRVTARVRVRATVRIGVLTRSLSLTQP